MRANAAPVTCRDGAGVDGGGRLTSSGALARAPHYAAPQFEPGPRDQKRGPFSLGGKRHQMAWRLGKVLYWLSCIGAVFVAGTGVAIYVAAGAKNDGLILMGVLLVLAALPWAIGKAFLYIFSAR